MSTRLITRIVAVALIVGTVYYASSYIFRRGEYLKSVELPSKPNLPLHHQQITSNTNNSTPNSYDVDGHGNHRPQTSIDDVMKLIIDETNPKLQQQCFFVSGYTGCPHFGAAKALGAKLEKAVENVKVNIIEVGRPIWVDSLRQKWKKVRTTWNQNVKSLCLSEKSIYMLTQFIIHRKFLEPKVTTHHPLFGVAAKRERQSL